MLVSLMRKTIIFYFLFLYLYFDGYSQQDPYFSSYSFNPVIINTSLSSFEEKNYATAIYRNQWTGYSSYSSSNLSYFKGGSPVTKLLTVVLKDKKKKLSFGANIIDDELGPKSTFEIKPFISFNKKISNSILSLSLSPSFGNQTLNFDQFIFVDRTDPFNIQGKETEWQPDFDIGFSYLGNQFLLSLSINHLLTPSFNFGIPGLINRTDITYNILSKYSLEIDRDLTIEPYLLLRSDLSSFTFDISGLATYKDRFKVGTSYRHNEAVILFLGYSLLKKNKLHLGYAFDYVIKNVNAKSTASNEILIRYDLPMPQVKKPIRTPRFIY
tara:strand:+ start:1232 stop:2209 length:978 start_codon:yes stop_codon:yes gene_type:complete